MAQRSKRDRFHSQDKPPSECSVHSGLTKLHTSFFKSGSLPDELSSCPPIPIRRKHNRRFHSGLTERGVAPCSTTSSRRFLKNSLFEIPLILFWILVTVASFSGCTASLNSQISPIRSSDQAQKDLCNGAKSGDLRKVEDAIAKGARVDGRCIMANPLIHAVAGGHRDMVAYLIEKGADVNGRAEGKFGDAPLFLAVVLGDPEMAKLLIMKGADVNVNGMYGVPALQRAVLAGNLTLVRLLVENGADVRVMSQRGTPLHDARDYPIAKLLISKGADVNARDFGGDVPLHRTRSIGIVELLVASGADVNARNDEGNTPLHEALERGKEWSLIKFLIEHGADVNARNGEGMTPLGLLRAKKGIPPEFDRLIEEYGGHE